MFFLQNGRRNNKSSILLLHSYSRYLESGSHLLHWLFSFFTVTTADCHFWLSEYWKSKSNSKSHIRSIQIIYIYIYIYIYIHVHAYYVRICVCIGGVYIWMYIFRHYVYKLACILFWSYHPVHIEKEKKSSEKKLK